jgi:hypothetical protein
MYTTPQTYLRNPAAQDRHTANRKRKSRVAGPWRGVRWRPGLTNYQIVLPRRTRVIAAHQLFFKEAYAMIEVRGMGDRRETVRYEEESARGSIYPLLSLGPASRPSILAKTPRGLNSGTSENPF